MAIKKIDLTKIVKEIKTESKTIKKREQDEQLEEAASRFIDTSRIKKLSGNKKILSNRDIIEHSSKIVEEVKQSESLPENNKKQEQEIFEPQVRSEIYSIGKKLKIIAKDSYGPSEEEFVKKTDPSDNKIFSKDNLRGRVGSYWTKDTLERGYKMVNVSSNIRNKSPIKLKYRKPTNDVGNSDFGRTVEWLEIEANKEMFKTSNNNYSKDYWESFINGSKFEGSTKKKGRLEEKFSPTVETNKFFFDYTHELPIPFENREIEKLNLFINTLAYKVEPEYNFYIKAYEERITENSVLENTLPNLYVFLSENAKKNPNPEFKRFINLEDALPVDTKIFNKKTTREKKKIQKEPIGEYYEMYSRKYDEAIKNGSVSRLNKKFSNILLASEDYDLVSQYNEKREMFPMYVDMQFSTDKTTSFCEILNQSKMGKQFLKVVADNIANNRFEVYDCVESIETISQNTGKSNPRRTAILNEKTKRYLNVADILNTIIEGGLPAVDPSAVFLGDYQNEVDTSGGQSGKFFKSLMRTIFSGKMQKFINLNFRTLKEMNEGENCYSETVLYRVAKFDGTKENGNLLQNYYFLNSNKIDMLRFIDTQVKYDKQYTYVVYAYQMVLGTKYWYDNLITNKFDSRAIVKAYQEPSLIMMEHEYLTSEVRLLDDPPVIPDINIVPYKGVDDRILIMMNGNVGDYLMEPIAIKKSDQQYFNKLRKQKKKSEDEKIRFKSDDHSSMFEIYRTEEHPYSFKDFDGKLVSTVRSDVNLKTIQSATSAAHVDKIEPNKKYYYTFRSIDNHGNISNPTPIVRIEMINENGTIFLLKDVVEFREKEKQVFKEAKRFIQIVPNVFQSLIDEEKSGFNSANSADDIKGEIHLGTVDEKVWGKTFVIRLTSKSTGKKVDFRVKFEHKHKKKED